MKFPASAVVAACAFTLTRAANPLLDDVGRREFRSSHLEHGFYTKRARGTGNQKESKSSKSKSSKSGSMTEDLTENPTSSPTGSPTTSPTASPTGSPTSSPTVSPTISPTASPTASPTGSPTASPTMSPTASPTESPIPLEPCRYLETTLQGADWSLSDLTKESIQSIIEDYSIDVAAMGNFREKPNLLTCEQCEILIDYHGIENEPAWSGTLQSRAFDARDRELAAEELISLIGKDKVQDILTFFYDAVGMHAPISKIFVRRVNNDGSVGNYVDFHNDLVSKGGKISTMVITLNSIDSIEGGDMVFLLNQDEAVVASCAQGKAIAHSYEALHAIAPHKGSRITLVIEMNHDDEPVIENLLEGTALV